jgi:hypothetical protein
MFDVSVGSIAARLGGSHSAVSTMTLVSMYVFDF